MPDTLGGTSGGVFFFFLLDNLQNIEFYNSLWILGIATDPNGLMAQEEAPGAEG